MVTPNLKRIRSVGLEWFQRLHGHRLVHTDHRQSQRSGRECKRERFSLVTIRDVKCCEGFRLDTTGTDCLPVLVLCLHLTLDFLHDSLHQWRWIFGVKKEWSFVHVSSLVDFGGNCVPLKNLFRLGEQRLPPWRFHTRRQSHLGDHEWTHRILTHRAWSSRHPLHGLDRWASRFRQERDRWFRTCVSFELGSVWHGSADRSVSVATVLDISFYLFLETKSDRNQMNSL